MNIMNLAIILDDTTIENWVYQLINKINKEKNIRISTLIIHPEKRMRKSALLRCYCSFENKILNLNNNALSKKEIKNLSEFSIINIKEDYQLLEKNDFDLILNFSHKKTSFEFTKFSKFGVWFLYLGNYRSHRSILPEITEWLSGNDECGITLLSAKKNSTSYSIVDFVTISNDRASVIRCINTKCFQSIPLIFRNIKRVNSNHQSNTNFVLNNYSKKYIKNVKDIDIIKLLISRIWETFRTKYSRLLYFNQWIIMYQINSDFKYNLDCKNFIKMLPPKDRMWADPFTVFKNNTYYIFIEELIYKNKIGHLSVIEMDAFGNYSIPKPILIKPYHLSYPFIIEDNDELYMIPETSQNKTIELYKCVNFPLKWEFVKNIMTNVVAVDTTVYKKNDQYWLFTNIREQEGASKHIELSLFSSNGILSDNWIPHPNSPIIKNVSKARPAGNLFSIDDQLYRPSQDCSKHYGYALSINKIKEMNPTNYDEQLISKIRPDWDSSIMSTHTINFKNNLVVIDARMKRKK